MSDQGIAGNRIRRVLMTADTIGGVWTFALELAECLSHDGVEVVLASLGGEPSPQQSAAAARLQNVCLLTSTFKLEWMEDPWEDVAASGHWLKQIADEYHPDLIHLNSFGNGAVALGYPVVLTAHSCVLSWWAAVRGGSIPEKWNRYRDAVTQALQSANVVTAPSRFMAEALAVHYAFTGSVDVIYNGRDARRYCSEEKQHFIFTAGRLWDEGKNAIALTEIAPSLSWPVYVAGNGVADNCRKLGVLDADEMASCYAKAAVYALPALYEPFGLSVLEAALSGCALVLGDIPGLRELWDDAALFVPPQDRTALRDALEVLSADDALRREMSDRSYRHASRYSSSSMHEHYRVLYETAHCRKPICVS